jgi:hypothetical protein
VERWGHQVNKCKYCKADGVFRRHRGWKRAYGMVIEALPEETGRNRQATPKERRARPRPYQVFLHVEPFARISGTQYPYHQSGIDAPRRSSKIACRGIVSDAQCT